MQELARGPRGQQAGPREHRLSGNVIFGSVTRLQSQCDEGEESLVALGVKASCQVAEREGLTFGVHLSAASPSSP